MSKAHKTVKVTVGDQTEEIDQFIAPLIKTLWELGIITVNSCENNVPSGFVWIEFMSCTELENFLNAVAIYSDEANSMYNRITANWSSSKKDESKFWKYDINPNDLGVEQHITENDSVEEIFSGNHQFIMTASVRFPREDVAEIVKNLNNFSEKRFNK